MTQNTSDDSVTTWTIDPAHTTVEFSAKHLMVTTVKGRFTEVSGMIRVDDAHPEQSSTEITIQTGSIDTRQEQRDDHLRSADFLNAAVHPTITFRSTRVERVGKERYTVAGDLTIHDVTRPVVLDVTEEGRAKDPWGGERIGFSATTKIDRRDFGLTWNQTLETGGLLVGNEIKISIDVQAVKVVSQQAAA